jgi:hypothetical protein
MPQGTQVEIMMPGTNEKRYLAGALNIPTGTIAHWGVVSQSHGALSGLTPAPGPDLPGPRVFPPHGCGGQR